MRLLTCLSFLLFAVPATVSACEGECIVGITKAFVGNYSHPIQSVMEKLAEEISGMITGRPSTATSMHYVSPLVEAYNQNPYDGMKTAIFPNYFHGKCQQDGIDPPGCPNPDCPVVCGTPGSLVHFYSTLRYIAFNESRAALEAIVSPDSSAYKRVEKAVMDASQAQSRRMSRIYPRVPAKASQHTASRHIPPAESTPSANSGAPSGIGSVTPSDGTILETVCGGNADEETSGLPDCSWEVAMKEYILSFP
ncbi:hypothetical protein B0H21DRAFT_691825 [Amylocystis lapponica]|nr:hypothetical protein B0H21DRAFT_691825 [Amylocystis lapponica]